MLASAGALALGPAAAQVDPLAPLPTQPRPQMVPVPATPIMQVQQTRPTQPSGFEQYKAYLVGRARSAGVREATIQATIPYLRLNSQ